MADTESVYTETLELLGKAAEARISRRTIARRTGLGFDWLQKLAAGAIDDPGVKKIETLNRGLKVLLSEVDRGGEGHVVVA